MSLFQVNFEGQSQTVVDLPSNTSSYTVPVSKWKVGPVYTNKNYYCAASLYPSSEVGSSGSITKIEYLFYHVSPSSVTSRDLEVYMGEISSSTLTTSAVSSFDDGYITSDNMTKVFDGTISLLGPTGTYVWESISLDTPFSYGGSNNLVIMYYDKTGSTTGTNSYSVQVSTSDNRSLGRSYGTYSIDTENPAFGTVKTHVPRIRLTVEEILPVSLLSLEAKCKADYAELNWVTASEINNDYFVVERSDKDGLFDYIGEVEGYGTTSNMSQYSYKDYQYESGLAYYRLTQFDFDGESEVFQAISVNCQDVLSESASLSLASDKINGSIQVISEVEENQFYDLVIYDATGKKVYSGQGFTESGQINDKVFIHTQATGIYIVQLVVEDKLISEKLIW